jgi:hypothetical protein
MDVTTVNIDHAVAVKKKCTVMHCCQSIACSTRALPALSISTRQLCSSRWLLNELRP